MNVLRQRTELHDEVAYYLQDILGNLLAFLLPLGYLWLLWTLRPFGQPPENIWVPLSVFFLTLISTYKLGPRSSPFAILVLVWGLFLTIAFSSLVYRNIDIVQFQIAPLVITLGLLSWRVIITIALSTYANLFLVARLTGVSLYDVLFPAIVIAIAITSAGLSARYLHSVMKVVWNRNDELDRMITLARERGGELRHMVKQLDESNTRFLNMNKKLEVATLEAQEARRMKQQFAQNITHELRTPLNLIVGFIELITQSTGYYSEPLPYAYLRDLDIVYNNARHLQSLIDDILDMSRIDAAQMTISPSKTNIVELLHQAKETIRGLVESKGLYLNLEIAKEEFPIIEIDQIRIKQVIFNLINNAVRFTDQGGITIHCRKNADSIQIQVSDTGVGITQDSIPRIFDVFHQAEENQRGGTGLGLAISKQFVEMHSGKIWVESVIGEGSDFIFTIPISTFDQTQSSLTNISSDTYRHLNTKTQKVLFVISQSQSAISILSRYLCDCEVIPIMDISRLEQTARSMPPDVILLDTSTESFLIDEHALWQQWQSTPIITCSLAGEERKRKELAIEAFMTKPVSIDQIRQLMRQFGSNIDTVMVVDDNRDFVSYIARIMDHPVRRYNVIRAYSAIEALKLLEEHTPDLILLDLEMNGMGGLEFIDNLRSNSLTKQIPIAVITGDEADNEFGIIDGNFSVVCHDGIQSHQLISWIQAIIDA